MLGWEWGRILRRQKLACNPTSKNVQLKGFDLNIYTDSWVYIHRSCDLLNDIHEYYD